MQNATEITRGFVQRLEVGRAGLVSVSLIEVTGAIRNFVIEDLDADPERFNERLSKLGILRDAMDRAEPVEIQHAQGESGATILSVARITRDQLDPNQQVGQASGLVLSVLLQSQNGISGNTEQHDIADVVIISESLSPFALELNMQVPERHVASHQFELLNDAMLHGRYVRVLYTTSNSDNVGRPRIIAVMTNVTPAFGREGADTTELHGFVESLSLIPLAAAAVGTLAHVRFTTTLAFDGPGGTVGLDPFIPETIDLLVPKGSLAYALFEAGLRDNLRMRVQGLTRSQKGDDRPEPEPGRTPTNVPASVEDVPPAMVAVESETGGRRGEATDAMVEMVEMATARRANMATVERAVTVSASAQNFTLVTGAELLAPLASASRPVWVLISRETLDYGPEQMLCTPGLPTSDLTPRSLRNMRIPYPAVWKGMGCFNAGVYRFQFNLQTEFRVLVDDRELCIYDTEVETVKIAHACLGGEHQVFVELYDWICDYNFVMDVYRIR